MLWCISVSYISIDKQINKYITDEHHPYVLRVKLQSGTQYYPDNINFSSLVLDDVLKNLLN